MFAALTAIQSRFFIRLRAAPAGFLGVPSVWQFQFVKLKSRNSGSVTLSATQIPVCHNAAAAMMSAQRIALPCRRFSAYKRLPFMKLLLKHGHVIRWDSHGHVEQLTKHHVLIEDNKILSVSDS